MGIYIALNVNSYFVISNFVLFNLYFYFYFCGKVRGSTVYPSLKLLSHWMDRLSMHVEWINYKEHSHLSN